MSGRKPLPKPCFLDRCEYLGFIRGDRRWRSRRPSRYYTWDALHGEIEVFDRFGRHVGVIDAVTGVPRGEAVRGRVIHV